MRSGVGQVVGLKLGVDLAPLSAGTEHRVSMEPVQVVSFRNKRKSVSDFARFQKARQGPQVHQVSSEACVPTQALSLAPTQTLFGQTAGVAICQEYGEHHAAEEEFAVATRSSAKLVEARAVEPKAVSGPGIILDSSEDLFLDLSVKTALRLSTPHESFKWLRRLPPCLRCQQPRVSDASRCAMEDAVADVCRSSLPMLLEDTEKAVRWMERIAACCSWYELAGPSIPTVPRTTEGSDERAAWRRVDQWDESYRSLEVLLRQGLIPGFVLAGDRFSVTVLGESGKRLRPGTESEMFAVLCPSQDEIRVMLQENHVEFEVAPCGAVPSGTGIVATTEATRSLSRRPSDIKDLVALRRDGEKVKTPDAVEVAGVPMSSALWFEGSWRVHALLDVLRQSFLAAPLTAAPSQPRLPRLVSPHPFVNAVANTAEVKTQTLTNGQHTAELTGMFFPQQVQGLLKLLRVFLQTFSCQLTPEPRHSVGINSFTKLGMQQVESVDCASVADTNGTTFWKWGFKLGSGA